MVLTGKAAKHFIKKANIALKNKNSVDFSKEVSEMKEIIKKSELATKLKETLDNMSQEEFDKEWKETTKLNLGGISIDDYLKYNKDIMKEQIISFETAKLAKEKGYLESCLKPYNSEGGFLQRNYDLCEYIIEKDYPIYSAPSQTLLQKWLREEHEIDIYINRSFSMKHSYHYEVLNKCDYDNIIQQDCIPNRSYEECLEEALLEGLNLIK